MRRMWPFQNKPGFVANKSFDVQVHGYILWRKNWELQRWFEILLRRMNNMAFAFKHSFSEYHDGANDGFISGRDGEFHMRLHLLTTWIH